MRGLDIPGPASTGQDIGPALECGQTIRGPRVARRAHGGKITLDSLETVVCRTESR